jgi:site-specific DNA recombinase
MATPNFTAIVYARVSTAEQALGYSLTTQAEKCRDWAAERGYTVLAEYQDAHTGEALDRPGLNAAIEAAKTLLPAFVVVLDVDRLGRDLAVRAIAERELTRHGAKLTFVLGGDNGTPDGKLLNDIKGAIAAYEQYQRNERSRRGKDGRVRAGHPLVAARPAYGYRYIAGERTGRLEPDPDEAPVVRNIFHWCAVEGLTTYAIAKRLYDQQVPTRADLDPHVAKKTGLHFWDPHTIARIIGNETHKGIWYWNKTKRVPMPGNPDKKVQRPRPREEWLSLPVEPLVDAGTWERAQEQLARNKQQARRNAKRKYLLSSLVFCSCGRRWVGRYKNHLDRAYYRCPTTEGEPWRATCTARFGMEQRKLERAVLDAVKAFLLDPEVRRASLGAERERVVADRERHAADLAAIDANLVRVERQIGKLLDAMLVGDFPREMVDQRRRDLVAEQHRLAREREQRLTALDEPVIDVEAAIADLSPTVESAFAHAEPAELRRLLDLLRVEVHVINRETIRLTGVLGNVVTHLSGSRLPGS